MTARPRPTNRDGLCLDGRRVRAGVFAHGISARLNAKVERAKWIQAGLNRLRAQDRDELSTLLIVLHGAMNALRRDECGDPTIFGSRGTIRACDGMFHVYVRCRSPMHGTYAKKQLAGFATVHQDGDDEGDLVLARMPDESEAETLRHYIGLRQTRNAGPDHGYWLHRKAI
jgi:hypothetical protein